MQVKSATYDAGCIRQQGMSGPAKMGWLNAGLANADRVACQPCTVRRTACRACSAPLTAAAVTVTMHSSSAGANCVQLSESSKHLRAPNNFTASECAVLTWARLCRQPLLPCPQPHSLTLLHHRLTPLLYDPWWDHHCCCWCWWIEALQLRCLLLVLLGICCKQLAAENGTAAW